MTVQNDQNNKSISKHLFLHMFGIVTVMTLLSIVYFVFHEISRFNEQKAIIKTKYYNQQKEYIKAQVENAVSYINYKSETTEKQLKRRLKNRVEIAYQIADNLYNKNKHNHSTEELKSLIRESLRPIRFDKGSGYYFIGNFNGTDELFPVAPEYEGKNLYNLQDSKGNFVMKDEIKAAEKEEGGFITHYWTKPNADSGMVFAKISYVKAFEPLNWYIGTGVYLDDFTKEVQKETLERVSKIRFGNEGYVFVNTYDGIPLITDGKIVKEKRNIWELEDPNGIKVIQEERKAVNNPKGDYIYYVWNKLSKPEPAAKISFIKGIPDWEWMVGAGVYVDEIEDQLNVMRSELNKTIAANLLKSISVIVFIYILLFIIARRFSNKVLTNVQVLNKFFDIASGSPQEIDANSLEFKEFKSIAKSANYMIRKRVHAEENLQIEKKHFEKLFENAPAAIIILNKDLRVDKTNNLFQQIFHLSNEETQNKSIYNCLTFAKEENFVSFLNTIKSGESDIIQLSYFDLTKNQQLVFSVSGTTITSGDNFLGIYLLFSDITEEINIKDNLRKAKEKAEESDKLKTAFLSNMSHEIRTPMNAIIGFSDLLSDPDISAENKENFISIIKSSGNTLLNLINDIIDIAKIESGQLNINNEITDINSIINELNETYDKKILTAGKEIKINVKNKIKFETDFLLIDSFRLKQVFINLLENAIKFTQTGTINFGIENITNDKIIYYVKDTGIGIPADKNHLIFERFRQVESSLARRFGGTGLGLSISKSIVELMGGTIWFTSEEGKGTTFYFSTQYIPYQSENPTKDTNQDTAIEEFNWSKRIFLIVEDNIPNYMLLKTYLEETGVEIIHTTDGKTAIEEFKNNQTIDLILLDIQLPDISGYSVASEIKKMNNNTKILAQTAFAMTEDKQKALKNYCDDYIAKPIKRKLLLQQINKLLNLN